MTKTREILKERGDRYGNFKYHAKLCQSLKDVMRTGSSWPACSPSQKQALETIADKIARMLNGDPDYDDNWQDIIGYSQLILDQLHHRGSDIDKYPIPIGTLDGEGNIYDGDQFIVIDSNRGAKLYETYQTGFKTDEDLH